MNDKGPTRLYKVEPKNNIKDMIVDWIYDNQIMLLMFGIGIIFGLIWSAVWFMTPPLESGAWYNHHY